MSFKIMQAPFAPADHELVGDSVTPSAPVAPPSVTNDARKAELQALVHVGLYCYSASINYQSLVSHQRLHALN